MSEHGEIIEDQRASASRGGGVTVASLRRIVSTWRLNSALGGIGTDNRARGHWRNAARLSVREVCITDRRGRILSRGTSPLAPLPSGEGNRMGPRDRFN